MKYHFEFELIANYLQSLKNLLFSQLNELNKKTLENVYELRSFTAVLTVYSVQLFALHLKDFFLKLRYYFF